MLPPVRARNIIPERLSDHEMPEPVVLLSEKARISNAELITKTDFGPAEGSMGGNVSGLCDGGAIEAQIFNFVLQLNRRTTVELCSFAPLLQNPCWWQCFYAVVYSWVFFVSFSVFSNWFSV